MVQLYLAHKQLLIESSFYVAGWFCNGNVLQKERMFDFI